MPEGNMESSATNIRLVTLNCRSLSTPTSTELQQAYPDYPAMQTVYLAFCDICIHRLLHCTEHASGIALPSISTITPSTAAMLMKGRSVDQRRQDAPLYDCVIVEDSNWVARAHAPTETTEDHNKDAFYGELNTLISKIPSQQAVIVGIDANAKMGPGQQSDVLEKWFYPMEQTSDNGCRLIDLCEQMNIIVASTFKRNHRRHQLTWQRTTPLKPKEQRKRKIPTPKLHLDCVLTKKIPLSDIRKELSGKSLSIPTNAHLFTASWYGSRKGIGELNISRSSIWHV
ncbi:hypothetical protein RB195_014365 [Necator americanus]|uniref:Endonuclease/exonuclease/phosphatase domain-containing protein n=1 Tax=Necator americanus TaxID=51031 RepID=A0ABR1DZS4_NECAM